MINVMPLYFLFYSMGICCFVLVSLAISPASGEFSIIHIGPTGCVIIIVLGYILCLPFAIWFYRDLVERITEKYIEPPRRIRRTQEKIAELRKISKTVCFTKEFLDELLRKLNEVPDGIEEVDNVQKYDKLWDSVPIEICFFHNDFQYELGIYMDKASRHHIKSVIFREDGIDKGTLVSLFKGARGAYSFIKKTTSMFNDDGRQIQYGYDFPYITREEFIKAVEKDNLINANIELYSSKRISF